MRVWITKFALTTGIIERDVELRGDMVSWREPNDYATRFAHREGRDWHRSRSAATKRAEHMRREKIVSLRKSLSKYESMSFVETE